MFLIVNIIVVELKIIFHNSSLFNNAEEHFVVLLLDAGALFPLLIWSHCKAILNKVSYAKQYNYERKKDGKDSNVFFYQFGQVPYY